MKGIDIFWNPIVLLSWFWILSFIGGYIASGFFFLFFLGMRFPGVTIARVYPVNQELTDRPVRGFPNTITSGAGASDWVIKFCALVKCFALIYYLSNGTKIFYTVPCIDLQYPFHKGFYRSMFQL